SPRSTRVTPGGHTSSGGPTAATRPSSTSRPAPACRPGRTASNTPAAWKNVRSAMVDVHLTDGGVGQDIIAPSDVGAEPLDDRAGVLTGRQDGLAGRHGGGHEPHRQLTAAVAVDPLDQHDHGVTSHLVAERAAVGG